MKKLFCTSVVTLNILLLICITGCRTVSPQVQDEYIRNNLNQEKHVLFDEYRQAVQKVMAEEEIPGVSIALVDRDGIQWAAGFGYTDKNQKTPVTTETIFAAMSITKVITATAVMFAVQDGAVELDVPIVEYLPGFSVNSRFEENPQNKITLRHLLTHTSGLAFDTTVGNGGEMQNVSFEDHIKSISNTWLRYKVGEKILYSNIGMDLAAYILQVRTGKPYSQYLSERIFKPMNMSNSSTDLTFIRRHPNRAIGHQPHVKEAPLGIVDFYLGAGSVFTNAIDLARFIQFHLNRGRVDQEPILDERFIDMMYTPSPLLYPSEGSKGNAVGILRSKSKDGNHQLGHDGGGLGFCAYMYWYPEYGFGAVIMVNSSLNKDNGAEAWINSFMKMMISKKLVERNGLFDTIPWEEVWTINSVEHDPNTFTPYQPTWKKYRGTYRIRSSSYKPYGYSKILLNFFGIPDYEVQVREKEGYLESVYQGRHERLDEYQPGLFFTKDGECLDFRSEIPTWQNYRLDKIK